MLIIPVLKINYRIYRSTDDILPVNSLFTVEFSFQHKLQKKFNYVDNF
jgi:hypothetical protein